MLVIVIETPSTQQFRESMILMTDIDSIELSTNKHQV